MGCSPPPQIPQKCGNYIYGSIHLKFHVSFPDQLKQDMKDAARAWNELIGKEVIVIDQSATLSSLSQNGESSIAYWTSGWPNPNQQANTTVYWSSQAIFEADMQINAQNFKLGDASKDWTLVDSKSLFLHELGHVIGLLHSPDPRSVMFSSLPTGFVRLQFQPWEVEEVKCRYGD